MHRDAEEVGRGAEIISFPRRGRASPLADEEAFLLAQAIRRGDPVSDHDFDRVYEGRWRQPSERHWSSIEVVRAVLESVCLNETHTVLDIGSGVGKFCLLGSLLSEARFVGVERRPELVHAAERARLRLGIDRASFICADAFDLDWSSFDCLYLFNPFEEHLMDAQARIDNAAPFSEEDYRRSVEETGRRLQALRPGTWVVTHWGFGGQIPPSFTWVGSESRGEGGIECWCRNPTS